jgi:hypothetical protein
VGDQGPSPKRAHRHGCGRVTERFRKQLGTKECPRTQKWARDRVLEWIEVWHRNAMLRTVPASYTETERGTRCDEGWLGTRNSDSPNRPCTQPSCNGTPFLIAYANVQNHDMQARRLGSQK